MHLNTSCDFLGIARGFGCGALSIGSLAVLRTRAGFWKDKVNVIKSQYLFLWLGQLRQKYPVKLVCVCKKIIFEHIMFLKKMSDAFLRML